MTAPELPESNINPNFRAPREYCVHEHTVIRMQNTCGIVRTVVVCVQCGMAVE
jgi:hypothetical protein